MASNNDKKYLKLIENIINLCIRKIKDLYFVKSSFADLINVYLLLEDKGLKHNIETKAKEILTETDLNKIKKYLQELLIIVSTANKSAETYIKVDENKRFKSDRYKEDCKRYENLEKNIKELENKILNSPIYQKRLHERIKENNKTWPGYLHARLTSNIRIMYIYDQKERKITFDAIITKNEFDKSQ